MPATTGERQIGDTMTDIAPNHRARYDWAVKMLRERLEPGARVLDAASGVGYGSFMLAEAGFRVMAVDRDDEAADYQRRVFKHPRVQFLQADLFEFGPDRWPDRPKMFDAAVSLETIEHVPHDWIKRLKLATNLLVGTVPNQDVVPFDPKKHAFHLRHYTKTEVETELLPKWTIEEWATQYGKWEDFEMRPGHDGMTLGFVARL